MSAKRNKIITNNVGYYHSYRYHSLDYLHRIKKMHGIKRVVTFCTLTMVLPTMLLIVPLYLRHSIYADVQFAVTESDIVEITDGISPIFCSKHTLKMNETFNAFQVSRRPEKTSYRKHIRLKKSMTLPDDTLEYWGFYLLKGATVALSVCSRFEGSSILVVKGERNLRTCGMLEHNKNKAKATGIFLPKADQQVKITFESNAQEINSKELITSRINKESQQDARLNRTSEKLLEIKKNVTTLSHMQNAKKNKDENFNSEKLKNELQKDKELEALLSTAEKYLNKHINNKSDQQNPTPKSKYLERRMVKSYEIENEDEKDYDDNSELNNNHKKIVYHKKNYNKTLEIQKKFSKNYKERIKLLAKDLGLNQENNAYEDENHGKEKENEEIKLRYKRSQHPIKPELLDRGIRHGGNAAKNVTNDSDSSISSFENGLLNCYGGNVLLAHEFDPSDECMDVSYLLNGNKHMQTIHEVAEDGYYYYIFYSDNDIVSNDIHAVFEIYKPTLQYENVTKACINMTECSFPLSITSIDRVIVEVPTRDGIDHEIDDISVLVSVCVPRMGIYVIFPITVLFLILGCAFM